MVKVSLSESQSKKGSSAKLASRLAWVIGHHQPMMETERTLVNRGRAQPERTLKGLRALGDRRYERNPPMPDSPDACGDLFCTNRDSLKAAAPDGRSV